MKEAGVEVFELGGVEPNPKLSSVYDGIRICREKRVEVVVAVGGGSPIDCAKAIAVGAAEGGDVWDFCSETDCVESSAHRGGFNSCGYRSGNERALCHLQREDKREICDPL